ncbi:hypothetical protein [Kribbella sp. CA-247076]|uniref:hypothetical protein n=1 Tax=Kribbella sp. CA-247076 TaxID=3239941 RepID=UPI003D9268F9
MADANVDNLVRRINRLVVEDTGGWSMADDDQILRTVTRSNRQALEPLADSLDVPARLVPGPRQQDQRPEIRAALTEVVAGCARVLEADEELPEALYQDGRDRLGVAMSRAYAALATPRLTPRLFPDGRAGDLGTFPPPALRGDVAAARAIAVAISARTGRGEEAVATALVAAGRGAVAPVAAKMLLNQRPGFAALPVPEQEALTAAVADQIEYDFEGRPQRRPAADLSAAVQDRHDAVAHGTNVITTASTVAGEEVEHLHALFDTIGWPENTPSVERASGGPEGTAAGDGSAAAVDSAVRFAPGHDPAAAGFAAVKPPATQPSANQAVSADQPKPRGLDGRS